MEYVTSADGTRISYERTGSGPPLVLVHGSLNDRNAWVMVRGPLGEKHTVYAMDRRGRAESGPIGEHDFERQIEDVLSVIEAAREPVDLIGHSFGAHCALGAAAAVPAMVKHLVLYEPPTLWQDRLDIAEAFEAEDPSEALAAFVAMIGNGPEAVVELKQTPAIWNYMLSFAPTMPSEGRALVAHGFEASRFSHLAMPALFLVGSETEKELGEVLRSLRRVMPHAEWVVFEGQGHAAQFMAPKVFADTVLEFLGR